MRKVAIVGLGNVGIAYLNNLITEKNLVNEIVLIDTNENKLEGELLDIKDSLSVINSSINIYIGDYKDTKNADILVISAGKNQDIGESRLDLLEVNKTIVKSITEKAILNGFNGIFIIATNPVDIMSYVVYKASNMSPNKVIGAGTILDTCRLKNLIKEKLNVSTNDININVIGEHGDNIVVLWSKGFVNMIPIDSLFTLDEKILMEENVKTRATKIINKKGYTNEGISLSLLEITKAILNNENKVLNISTYLDEIYIGMPAIINIDGVKGIVNIDYTEDEKRKLSSSINKTRKVIEDMEV